jgi:hypothetical protein
MGFLGIWAPGVLPAPVVLPIRDRVASNPGGHWTALAREVELQRQQDELEAERGELEQQRRHRQLEQEALEARRKLEGIQSGLAARLASFRQVLDDPDAPLEARMNAAEVLAGAHVYAATGNADAAYAAGEAARLAEARRVR